MANDTVTERRKRAASVREDYNPADYCACGCSILSGRHTPNCDLAPPEIRAKGLAIEDEAELDPAEQAMAELGAMSDAEFGERMADVRQVIGTPAGGVIRLRLPRDFAGTIELDMTG